MHTKRYPLDFTEVSVKLMAWQGETLTLLRDPETHMAALTLKRQIDDALACLDLCQQFQIRPGAKVTVLPDLQTMTPSCSYRVMEDNETDNQAHWTELAIDSYHLELFPGDMVIEIVR